MKNLVSIIVPIYKVERYLNRCILSIINQTYKNLQIILVDDGSPDNCPQICDSWSKKDSRIEVIHKKNGGLSDARNAGLRIAKGEFVLFVDSDDWIALNMVENMLNEMIINNVDMVICQFVVVEQSGNMTRLKPKLGKQIYTAKEAIKLLLDDKYITNHVWRKLYKRSYLTDDLFPKNKNYEDIYVMAELFHHCKKIVYLEEAYYYYLENPLGIVKNISKKNLEDLYDARMRSYSLIYKYYPDLKKYINSKKRKTYAYILKLKIINHIKNLYIYYWFKKIRIFINSRIKEISYSINILRTINKSKSPKFYIFGTPEYGNLGDHALTLGEDIFIKNNFPNHTIIHVPFEAENQLLLLFLRKIITSKDYISITAGGNIGTLYLSMNKKHEKIIKNLRKHSIFIFPQTFYYNDDEVGKKALSDTKKIYEKCNDLLVTVREEKSFEFVSKNLTNIKCMLLPDMVLNIPKFDSDFKRNGILLCLRNDCERTMLDIEYEKLLNVVNEKFDSIEEIDTHVYYSLSENEAKDQLNILWTKMSKSKLVITDRLHGMIFSTLTQTPCVVILSKSHKIKGCYEWLKDLNYVALVEKIDDLENAIDQVTSVKNPVYDNTKLIKLYDKLVNEIKK